MISIVLQIAATFFDARVPKTSLSSTLLRTRTRSLSSAYLTEIPTAAAPDDGCSRRARSAASLTRQMGKCAANRKTYLQASNSSWSY